MKIVLISPNPEHLASATATLRELGHTVVAAEGGKTRMRELAERELPQLMLVDGMCCGTEELVHVEHVTAHHPGIAVILMCPSHTPEFLLSSMRAGVREVLPSPAPAQALEAAVNRIAAKIGTKPTRQGKVVAFMSCKGGSGATFLASNIAWQLAESNSVLLMDLNLQFGDALSFLHDGRPPTTLSDVAHDIGRLDASLLASSTVKVAPSFSVLPAPEDLAHAMEIQPEQVEAILDIAVTQYDFVVLDTPRVLDTLTIRALDRAWRIFVVMQTGLPDVRNAARMLEAFRTLGYPADKTELIINRFEKAAEIGIEQVRRSVGAVRLNTVPNAWREVAASINHGEPLSRNARSNPVARQIAEFAQSLSPKQDESRAGLLSRLFRRA